MNGKKVNVPSYLVKPGDTVAIESKSQSLDRIKGAIEANASRVPPKWLELDAANFSAKVTARPERDDIDLPIDEQLIVEYYSK